MRLIDAHKVQMKLSEECQNIRYFDKDRKKPQIFAAGIAFAWEMLDNAPTVKAIPIEWLHSIMERQLIFAMESEMEGTTTVQDGVIHCVSGALACQVLANVIELWEKENE